MDCNTTESNPGSKPSLCSITQRKHRPADYLVFALSTNAMQKETIGLPEQLLLLFLFVFLSDCIISCVTQKGLGRGFWGSWVADGWEDESTKDWLFVRRETTRYPKLDKRLALYSGEGGIRQQLLSSETQEPETEVFHLHQFASLLNLHVLFQGCWHHVSRRENQHCSCFVLPSHPTFNTRVGLHVIMFIFECVPCQFWSQLSSVRSAVPLKQWSHISKRWVHGDLVAVASGRMLLVFFTWLCFFHFDCFLWTLWN